MIKHVELLLSFKDCESFLKPNETKLYLRLSVNKNCEYILGFYTTVLRR